MGILDRIMRAGCIRPEVPDDLRPDLSTGTSLEDLTLSEKLPAYTLPFAEGSGFSIIKSSIDALSNDLRKLSLDLWDSILNRSRLANIVRQMGASGVGMERVQIT